MNDDPYWTYVLKNVQGRFYVGSTDDLMRRVAQHNDPNQPKSKFTVKHGPWQLVWNESHPTRAAAVQRERLIKAMKSSAWINTHLLNVAAERVPTHRD
jgi:putative endonuclease